MTLGEERAISSQGKGTVVARLWQLVMALHQAQQGRTVAQLRERLGVSRSTLYRDLDRLEATNVGLEHFTVNGEARVRLLGLRTLAVAPTELQLAAVRLARESLAPLSGTSLVRELDGLLGQWSHRQGTAATVSQRAGGPERSQVLSAIDASMVGHRRVVLEYQGQTDAAPRCREVDPLTIRLEHEEAYLFGYCHEREDYRLFKIARVMSARESDKAAVDHSGIDLDALLAQSVKVWMGDPVVQVVVRISPRKARFATEYPLARHQELEMYPDGSAIVRARVKGITEALRWSLSWGADAEVLAPHELRSAIRTELTGAAGQYADGPISVSGKEVVSQSWDGEGVG